MLLCSLAFPKILSKNIYICGQKARETGMSRMVSNSHALKSNQKINL